MKRAVLYLRVSTIEQPTANQERELREIACRIGCKIVKVYKITAFRALRDPKFRPPPCRPPPLLEKLGWHAGAYSHRRETARCVCRVNALWRLDCSALAVCGFG